MKLIVGCPIFQRDWIFEEWYEAVVREAADYDLSFLFVTSRDDQATIDKIYETVDRSLYMYNWDVEKNVDRVHSWQVQDYDRMARLRNYMLSKVRPLAPDMFFSLDSDIILNEGSLKSMVSALQNSNAWACGINTSMVPNLWCESWMHYAPTAEVFVRACQPSNFNGVLNVDAIMAGKLMKPSAYEVDYKTDSQGEDLGWCRNVRLRGGKFIVTAAGTGRHVMLKDEYLNSKNSRND